MASLSVAGSCCPTDKIPRPTSLPNRASPQCAILSVFHQGRWFIRDFPVLGMIHHEQLLHIESPPVSLIAQHPGPAGTRRCGCPPHPCTHTPLSLYRRLCQGYAVALADREITECEDQGNQRGAGQPVDYSEQAASVDTCHLTWLGCE